MHLFIITGTSKGLGNSLLRNCLSQGDAVLSISRKAIEKNREEKSNLWQLKLDLKEISQLDFLYKETFEKLPHEQIEAYHLINNAAVIEPVGPIGLLSSTDIHDHITVNLEAPIQLCRLFIKSLSDSKKTQTVTNVSSGAATFAIPNWELYCATKSGLRLFTENMALDYKDKSHIKFVSFSPGVMDTQMQEQIRNKTEDEFSEVKRFREMKTQGQLLSPDLVAEKMCSFIKNNKNISDVHYDISDI